MKSLSSALRSYTAIATAILLPLAARSQGQAAGERPQFEVASIKLNNGCQNNRNSEPPPQPGRLQIGCVTLQNLIQVAYAGVVNGKPIMQQVKITGGPSWLESDFYSIAAKADGAAAVEVMIGPIVWLMSPRSDGVSGRRIIAKEWDAGRLASSTPEKVGTPAGW